MWKTVIILLLTLVVIPVLAYRSDVSPDPVQWELLRQSYAVCLVFAGLSFVLSTLTRNYSQVDKLWSILPVVYAWMAYMQFPGPRVGVMAILITIWGIRLTYNFSRRGGYSWKFWTGEEDYRWSVLRAKPEFQAPWKWMLFNLFFISFYQMSLIWMMTLPVIRSLDGRSWHMTDVILGLAALGMIILETIADQQQWDFQKEKYRRLESGSVTGTIYEKGFAHTGLWAHMRHPNYFAEQGFWVVIYLFSVSATGIWINWSIAGCLLLLALFKGSADFSEGISAKKYPAYVDYMKRVPRFIPFGKKAHG